MNNRRALAAVDVRKPPAGSGATRGDVHIRSGFAYPASSVKVGIFALLIDQAKRYGMFGVSGQIPDQPFGNWRPRADGNDKTFPVRKSPIGKSSIRCVGIRHCCEKKSPLGAESYVKRKE